MFTKFDKLAEIHGVDKIKTIGDCYVAASNVLNPNPDHAKSMIKMVCIPIQLLRASFEDGDMMLSLQAQDMHAAMLEVNHVFQTGLRLRIGIHSGAIMVHPRSVSQVACHMSCADNILRASCRLVSSVDLELHLIFGVRKHLNTYVVQKIREDGSAVYTSSVSPCLLLSLAYVNRTNHRNGQWCRRDRGT